MQPKFSFSPHQLRLNDLILRSLLVFYSVTSCQLFPLPVPIHKYNNNDEERPAPGNQMFTVEIIQQYHGHFIISFKNNKILPDTGNKICCLLSVAVSVLWAQFFSSWWHDAILIDIFVIKMSVVSNTEGRFNLKLRQEDHGNEFRN